MEREVVKGAPPPATPSTHCMPHMHGSVLYGLGRVRMNVPPLFLLSSPPPSRRADARAWPGSRNGRANAKHAMMPICHTTLCLFALKPRFYSSNSVSCLYLNPSLSRFIPLSLFSFIPLKQWPFPSSISTESCCPIPHFFLCFSFSFFFSPHLLLFFLTARKGNHHIHGFSWFLSHVRTMDHSVCLALSCCFTSRPACS